MNIKSIKCPECGANVYTESDESTVFCSHCGTQLSISTYGEKKKIDIGLQFGFNEKSKIEQMKQEDDIRAYQRKEEERKRIKREEKLEKKKTSIMVLRIIRWTCIIAGLVILLIANTVVSDRHLVHDLRNLSGVMIFLLYPALIIMSLINRFLY